ncbi:MAG: PrgI family protein, partial [Firmicutes bacterium]|nr:PrgI family protein [Bacillota bacterium]
LIGGVLSTRQLFYLLGGIGLGALLARALPGPIAARAIPVVLFAVLGAFLGFFRTPDLDLPVDRYLLLWYRYWRSPKEFPYCKDPSVLREPRGPFPGQRKTAGFGRERRENR